MKKLAAIALMLVNVFIVFSLISFMQMVLHANNTSGETSVALTVGNLASIILGLVDLTYVNYLIWKKVTK